MRFIMIIYVLLAFNQLTNPKQIFINYGEEKDSIQIFKYFHDVDHGFWVQFGAFNPIKSSNTMALYAKGWTGVSVEASPARIGLFHYLRPSCINILSAVGHPDTYVKLDEMNTYSTVIDKVKDYDIEYKKKKTVQEQIKVPSMSLKQACQRFFQKKPLFFSLDVQSMEPVVLMENNWTNPLCRPQIIYSQVDEENKYSGLPDTSEVMKDKNYTLLPELYSRKQIYITNEKYEYYMKKYKEGAKIIAEKQVEQFFKVIDPLCQYLHLKWIQKNGYDIKHDSVYIHFGQNGKSIEISQLQRKNLELGQNLIKKRPVVIFHFNPLNSLIIAPHKNFKTESVLIKREGTVDLKYTKITVQQEKEKDSYEVYVFDHQYTEGDKFPIHALETLASSQSSQESEKKIGPQEITNIRLQEYFENELKAEKKREKQRQAVRQKEKQREKERQVEREKQRVRDRERQVERQKQRQRQREKEKEGVEKFLKVNNLNQNKPTAQILFGEGDIGFFFYAILAAFLYLSWKFYELHKKFKELVQTITRVPFRDDQNL